MMPFFDTLFEASIRSVVLATVVYLLLWALRVRDAAWRHAAWTAVLCAMVAMPVLPYLFPPVPVDLPIAAAVINSMVPGVRHERRAKGAKRPFGASARRRTCVSPVQPGEPGPNFEREEA